MNKFFIGILFFIIPKAFAMEIKVSDRFPTLMELGGKITKVSFGNGMKEYVANVEGRFLALKAKTAATTITIYYIENKGNKNAKTSVFFGGLSYAPERQEIYDLTSPCSSAVKDKNAGLDIVEMEDHVEAVAIHF